MHFLYSPFLKRRLAVSFVQCLMIASMSVVPGGLHANPANPSLRVGEATFSNSGATSLIHQSSDRVIIDWQTFSIQQGETTRFIQPGSTSAALNRVTSGNPSEIYGNLQANGRVLLINPNGILVGPTGQIDTAGFLASTLDVSDSDFLRGGDMTFSGESTARVVNLGTINAIDGGSIFLLAREVVNYGTLNASGGTVGLAAGSRIMIKSEGMDERISILPGSKSGSVTNGSSGTVAAAVAEIKAAGGNEYAAAINNDGLVRATRFENRGGKIYLGSGGGRVRNRGTLRARKVKVKAPTSKVENSGTIDASSEVGNGGEIEIEAESVIGTVGGFLNTTGLNNGGSIKITASGELRLDDHLAANGQNGLGGSIRLTGDTVTLGDTAVIEANGATGGGTILVGGGRAGRDASISNARNTTVENGAAIFANATGSDGGTVILWADETMDFRGNVENRGVGGGAGGFTEVSGLRDLGFHGTVDTGGGDLLLDPFNYVIGATEAGNIVTALGMNNVTIDTTTDVGAFGSSGNAMDVGDITVNSEILYDSENDFTFLAMGDVNFNASVQNSNDTGGDINIVAGWDGTTTNINQFLNADVATTTRYGNANGSVFVGDGTQTSGIAVGSRSGTTNVFAHDVALQGANSGTSQFAQLGFQISDGIAFGNNDLRPVGDTDGSNVVVDGGITVHALNDLTATGGSGGNFNYAQVGHVGSGSSGVGIEAVASAAIEVSTGNDIVFTGGGVGGVGSNAYAQLGQGGYLARGNFSGTTTITTANDIRFTGGGNQVYAQLGQGGLSAVGNHSGTTTITRAGDITFQGGGGFNAYTQLGQGGFGADGNHSGTTTITTANDIRFTGGGVEAYAQLGQGGYLADGNHSGTTTITRANDIRFTGGGTNAYAQFGQGGFNANGNHSGTTTIATANDIVFTRGGFNAYAQLGHGGFEAAGNHSGRIDVTHTGDLTLNGQNTNNRYAILGHGDALVVGNGVGGFDPDSDAGQTVSGDVMVRTGGDATLSNATIGHQINADGSYSSGLTYLGVGGDLTADAASSFTSAAEADGGELRIYLADINNDLVDAATTFNGTAHGTTANPNDQGAFTFGMGPYDPGNSATGGAAVGGNFNYYVSSVAGFYNYIINGGEAANIVAALAAGDVDIDRNLNQANFGALLDTDGGTQFITVNNNIFYGSIYDLAFLTTGDINFNASVQNFDGSADAGDINIVAGWDGSTAYDTTTYSAVDVNAATPTLFGNQGFETSAMTTPTTGSVFIGDGTQPRPIAVGSRRGTTNVFAHDVALRGSDVNVPSSADAKYFSQLGFQIQDGVGLGMNDLRPMGDIDGRNVVVDGAITVHARHDLSASGGNNAVGLGNYAQVGHVGYDPVFGGGEIEADASAVIEISTGNDIRFSGGSGGNAYAQLGQGGTSTRGGHSGTTTITTANDIVFQGGTGSGAYAHLGQGGEGAIGSHSGMTTITEANDIRFLGGRRDSYAQLGQGGSDARGSHSGTTTITRARDILIRGGTEVISYAQLGQGGSGAVGSHSGTTTIAEARNITVLAGGGDFSYAQLGQGGGFAEGDHSGRIDILQTGDLTVTGVDNDERYAQIGHSDGLLVFDIGAGMHVPDPDAGQTVDGMVTVNTGGDIDVDNGFIGHLLGAEGASNTGGVLVQAGGDITLSNHLQFGSYDSTDDYTLLAEGDIHFNTSLQNRNATSGAINLVAGWDGTTGYNTGTFSAVDVNAAMPSLFGNQNGTSTGSVSIGDGTQTRAIAVGSRRGTTNVFAHDVALSGGNGPGGDRFAQLGFQVTDGIALGGMDLDPANSGGANVVVDGAIVAHARNDVSAIGGDPGSSNYVQIGHVGASGDDNGIVEADASSEIEVAAGDDIRFFGSGGISYAQLGQGGYEAEGNFGGTSTVTAGGDIEFRAILDSYAQLGQGGFDADGNHEGVTTVTAGNDIIFAAGRGNGHAQLGQGGTRANGNHSGTIMVTAGNDITFTGSDGAYAQLGQGGGGALGNHSGAITIVEANDVVFTGGGDDDSYAQLGNGGSNASGNHSGTITIVEAGDIRFTGGDDGNGYAQLGHGGGDATGNHSGTITITEARDIVFAGGDGDLAYAQLGQGGSGIDGNHSGTTTITSANDITFTAGDGEEAYAQLGQGGSGADGNHSGTTTITEANDLTFTAGDGEEAYAQLGQGGSGADGDHSGTIMITFVDDITLTGDGDEAYAQLGHGGERADGDHSGTITIASAVAINLLPGSSTDAYAQLGHGGASSNGAHSGDIVVNTLDDLLLHVGRFGDDAIIGHGGEGGVGAASGDIRVTVGEDLFLTRGGAGLAQIGHLNNGGGNIDVEGDVRVRVRDDATLTGGRIGHTGTYADVDGMNGIEGLTYIGVGQNGAVVNGGPGTLTASASSRFTSASEADGGELRFYIPSRAGYQIAAGAQLNDTAAPAPGSNPLANEQGFYQFGQGGYLTYDPGNFGIYLGAVPLFVDANSGTSVYGTAPVDPGLTLDMGMLDAGDSLASIGLDTNFNLTATSNAGNYNLMVDDSMLNARYRLVDSMDGLFTINQADLMVTIDDQSKPFGDAFVFNGTEFVTVGLQNGESLDTLDLTSVGTPAAAAPGGYDIFGGNPMGGAGFDANNYDISFNTGTLTVGARPPVVAPPANDSSVIDPEPSFNFDLEFPLDIKLITIAEDLRDEEDNDEEESEAEIPAADGTPGTLVTNADGTTTFVPDGPPQSDAIQLTP